MQTHQSPMSLLYQSASTSDMPFQYSAADQPDDSSSSATTSNSEKQEELPQTNKRLLLDMPWSDVQAWALRDKIPKYTVRASVKDPTTTDEQETLQTFTLWRALEQEVTELSGYPLSFLAQRYLEMSQNEEENENDDDDIAIPETALQVLPFLDDFVFETTGGLSGRVYGVKGVAEGARIQTAPVDQVQETVPKGYVRTADGTVIFELGSPAADVPSSTTKMADLAAQSLQRAAATTSRAAVAQSNLLAPSAEENNNNNLALDSDLVHIAALTGLVIAGSAAMGALSHHLTVNIFWV